MENNGSQSIFDIGNKELTDNEISALQKRTLHDRSGSLHGHSIEDFNQNNKGFIRHPSPKQSQIMTIKAGGGLITPFNRGKHNQTSMTATKN